MQQADKSTYLYQLKSLQEYLETLALTTTEDELEELYDECITIEFKNHTVHIPFDAVSFNLLSDMVASLIMEA